MKPLALTLALAAAMAAHPRAQEAGRPIAAWSRTTASPEDRGTPFERGAAVFNNWCTACHGKDLRNSPGSRSLEFKYQGKLPAALEDRRDLTPQSVRFFVRKGVAVMPFFRKTEVSDADLDALVAYLSNVKP